ncbi:MAG: stage III sporulation protein AB [Defluviitaleaceae bacterium]|nr:stage III sporulation protein AB [Defluviitaleaceae bacterium]
MIIQIIGGLLVCGACSLMGYQFGERASKRAAALLEMKKSLIMLKGEMDYSKCLMESAFANIAALSTGSPAKFFAAGAGHLAGGGEMAAAWEAALAELAAEDFAPDDIAALRRLAAPLTGIDPSTRDAGFAMAFNYIDDTCTHLATENIKKRKMYRGLGILCGLLVTVVLL